MADIHRPSTPPPREVPSTSLQLTPEQLKRIELNRLKAKANQREKEQEASTSTIANANNKRPIGVTPAVSHSPTAPSGSKPLRRDSRLGKYFEYDLSKMVNSKGGFLLEDGNEIDEEVRRKEQERERQRARQNLDPPMHLDPALNPKCKECQSMDLDQTFKKVFGCLVCKKCQNEKPEKYSLLTKTECKEVRALYDTLFILFTAELRDEELLPHLLKANPHAATYANMMLYVRYQVEDFAWKKWGSPEALDAEYERRTNEKKKKKNKKFEQGLKDLRKRTKEGVWQRRRDEEHKHVFGALEKGPDGMGQQVIFPPTAFMGDSNQAEHEQISTSLEVEQLDDNLFRSKSLWLPAHARGVFGGQVISQALVSATNCVNPAFGLHCYFLLSASPSTPIIYHVDRVRQGRSYATLGVKAVQSGRTVFVLMCSFQKPEPWQPFHQWPMPNEMRFIKAIESPTTSPGMKRYYQDALTVKERTRSPIAIKRAKEIDSPADGTVSYMYWMQTRNSPKYEAPFQKIVSPRTGSGRGVVHGRMYTRDGTLVAVTSQEGVVRANVGTGR
ncbi:hypothetical protein FPV67DRAFT_1565744 [Lyophyllum atratum]|nr:hypothetical protein FPV67DRAFT_1565744 [Lyophyllum atratum]